MVIYLLDYHFVVSIPSLELHPVRHASRDHVVVKSGQHLERECSVGNEIPFEHHTPSNVVEDSGHIIIYAELLECVGVYKLGGIHELNILQESGRRIVV